MKLLYPEVDIVPGRPGQRPQVTPVQEAMPLPGSTVIRLTNATTQENAYTLRLRSDAAGWQDSWYTIIALPASGADNAPPAGKRDERGPQDRWVKIYVPRGGNRDVLIRFNVPARPDARAGKYPFVALIETQVVGAAADNARRKDRVTELPSIAIVRPYYKWNIDLSPEERRVGRRKRSADFEVIVTNEGNDWLYCDLHLAKPKDLQLECPTLRLAVPPPGVDEMLPAKDGIDARPGTQRAVPLSAVSRLKTIRGEIVRQPVPLTAQRVDAPTVPPPVSDGYGGQGAVVSSPTTESQPLMGDRALVYYPPIPAKLTDFFTKSASSFRTLMFTAIGFVMAFTLGVIMYQNYFFNGIKVEPMTTEAKPDAPLLIGGQYLQGAQISMGTEGHFIPVAARPDLTRLDRVTILHVPKEFDHKQVKIRAQRFVSFLPFLAAALPHRDSTSIVQVGNMIDTASLAPVAEPVESGPYKPGATFTVSGRNLGTHGAVLVGGLKAKTLGWSPTQVIVAIRPEAKPGATLPVIVRAEGSPAPLDAGAIEIAAPQQVALGPGGGGGGPKPAAGGGGGPKPAGGGGGPKPAGGGGGPKPAAGGGGGPKPAAGGGGGPKPAGGGGGPKPAAGGGPVHVKRPHTQLASHTGTPVLRPAVSTVSPYNAALTGNWKAASASSDGSPEGLALKGYALVKAGNPGAAEAFISSALKQTEGQSGRARALALVASGAFAEAQGNKAQAITAYQQAGNVDASCALSYLTYAEYFHNNGKDGSAQKLLQVGLTEVQTPEEKAAIKAKISSP